MKKKIMIIIIIIIVFLIAFMQILRLLAINSFKAEALTYLEKKYEFPLTFSSIYYDWKNSQSSWYFDRTYYAYFTSNIDDELIIAVRGEIGKEKDDDFPLGYWRTKMDDNISSYGNKIFNGTINVNIAMYGKCVFEGRLSNVPTYEETMDNYIKNGGDTNNISINILIRRDFYNEDIEKIKQILLFIKKSGYLYGTTRISFQSDNIDNNFHKRLNVKYEDVNRYLLMSNDKILDLMQK